MTTGVPGVSGGPVVSWSISPSLPTGLSIDSNTGEVSGTPTVLSSLTIYTITATNTGGSATTTIDITVNDIVPSGITYSSNSFVETKGSSMTTGVPAVSGGPVVTWSVSPSAAKRTKHRFINRCNQRNAKCTFNNNNLHNYCD